MTLIYRTFGAMRIRIGLLVAITSFTAGLFLFQSCDNELDLVAPYKEIGVLYGLLNGSDSIQVVRIQKAYLGEGNALVMAQQPDSVYYPDILDAKLQEIQNGQVVNEIQLTRFIGPPLENGTFPSIPNVLYRTNGQQINYESEYRIRVENTETGYVMKAETPVVDTIRITRPFRGNAFPINWVGTSPTRVQYITGKDGKVFSLTIRFRFDEQNINTGVVEPKFIDWKFRDEIIVDPSVQETISLDIYGDDFYYFVASSLTADPDVIRTNPRLDFNLASGAEFLANYIEINSATTSILTVIPEYSNIESGVGIFSSRIFNSVPDKIMNSRSIDSLNNGLVTGHLGFQ